MVKYQCTYMYIVILNLAIPTPVVTMSAPNNLTTGQSMTLDCSAVAVRGITSRVDIVWYDNGIQVRRMDSVTTSIINGTAVMYRDSLNISSLTRQHDGKVYSCEVIINSEPLVTDNSSITINITCEFDCVIYVHTYVASITRIGEWC